MAYQLITVMLHKLIKFTATLLRYETIEYSGLVLLLSHYVEFLTCGLVKCLGELVDWWGHLQPALKNGLLALNADVLGPFHEAGQVTDRLDILT